LDEPSVSFDAEGFYLVTPEALMLLLFPSFALCLFSLKIVLATATSVAAAIKFTTGDRYV